MQKLIALPHSQWNSYALQSIYNRHNLKAVIHKSYRTFEFKNQKQTNVWNNEPFFFISYFAETLYRKCRLWQSKFHVSYQAQVERKELQRNNSSPQSIHFILCSFDLRGKVFPLFDFRGKEQSKEGKHPQCGEKNHKRFCHRFFTSNS